MRGLESVPSGHDDIGNAAAGRLVFEISGAIEQPETGPIENGSEFRGRDKSAALCHVRYLTFNLVISVQYSGQGCLRHFLSKGLALGPNGRDKLLKMREKSY